MWLPCNQLPLFTGCMQTLATCLCAAASLQDLQQIGFESAPCITRRTAPISQVIDVFLCSLPCCAIWLRLQHAVFKAKLQQRAVACSHKTAGRSLVTFRLRTVHDSWPRLHVIICGVTGRPAEITCPEPWFTWSDPKWLNVCCKHWNVVGFFLCGLPRMSSPCTHLFWSQGGGCLDGTPHPFLKSDFAPGMFSSFTCCLLLLLLLLPKCNDQLTQTHNTQCLHYRPGKMHAAIMTPATHGRTRKRVRQTKTRWDNLKGKKSSDGSKREREKRDDAPPSLLSACRTPLRPVLFFSSPP